MELKRPTKSLVWSCFVVGDNSADKKKPPRNSGQLRLMARNLLICGYLRTVPTLLLRMRLAHLEIFEFPTNTGVFLRGLKLCRESRT